MAGAVGIVATEAIDKIVANPIIERVEEIVNNANDVELEKPFNPLSNENEGNWSCGTKGVSFRICGTVFSNASTPQDWNPED